VDFAHPAHHIATPLNVSVVWELCVVQVVHFEGVHKGLPDSRIKNFHAVYGGEPEWQSVDAFVCLHPAATCELFVPFNRTIIIVTPTRYEAGRRSVGDWRRWNDRLARIASDGRNVVAANNQYDVEYMRSVATRTAVNSLPRL